MTASDDDAVTIFLAGDVMTGRGIDQILSHPGHPALREQWVDNARAYVDLAERAHGSVDAPVDDTYIWGDGLAVLDRERPDLRIVNLETSITVSDAFWPGKAVHYRMHPDNVGCLDAARIDACVVANNHVLDFGVPGLLQTLDVLAHAGIESVGAGRDLQEASAPARLVTESGAAVLLLGLGSPSSGVLREWGASRFRPGVHLLADLSLDRADEIAASLESTKRADDIAIVSIHWGSNWGWDVDPRQVAFAHRLVEGGVDIVHGHSSHHVRPVEVYRDKLILYGCGDLVTDYEGIRGHEQWRGDLGVMYFATVPVRGGPCRLRMIPVQMRKLRLTTAPAEDAKWLRDVLDQISRPFGTRFEHGDDGSIVLETNELQVTGARERNQ